MAQPTGRHRTPPTHSNARPLQIVQQQIRVLEHPPLARQPRRRIRRQRLQGILPRFVPREKKLPRIRMFRFLRTALNMTARSETAFRGKLPVEAQGSFPVRPAMLRPRVRPASPAEAGSGVCDEALDEVKARGEAFLGAAVSVVRVDLVGGTCSQGCHKGSDVALVFFCCLVVIIVPTKGWPEVQRADAGEEFDKLAELEGVALR